ncbi:MAG: DUF899 domain-containing protein [Solirubrobacterales bacterium]
MNLPPVVSASEWEEANEALIAKEKKATRERDALAAERRRQPMMLIEKEYVFDGPEGEVSLADLFEGRRQLILYRHFFEPEVSGFPESGCGGCAMFTDQVGHLAHFHARDTSFALASAAPVADIERYRKRMGWEIPWYSTTDGFSKDFGMDQYFRLNVFIRDGDQIFRTYQTTGRGVEALGPIWTFLDLTPLGRQEDWEDTPEGRSQGPRYEWWQLHDEYE